MQKLVIFTFLVTCSVWSMADHHKGDHHKMGGPGKGMFEQADVDGDGNISAAEHEDALSRMLENRRERFTEMDSDRNGSLSRDEAQAAKQKSDVESYAAYNAEYNAEHYAEYNAERPQPQVHRRLLIISGDVEFIENTIDVLLADLPGQCRTEAFNENQLKGKN